MLEEESKQNPIEVLEEGAERRFVLGLDTKQEVNTPLVVAHEDRLIIPPKLNHLKLAEMGLGPVAGRKGGFCIRKGDQLTMVAGAAPTLITVANTEEFQKALANGVVIIEPPKSR